MDVGSLDGVTAVSVTPSREQVFLRSAADQFLTLIPASVRLCRDRDSRQKESVANESMDERCTTVK